MTIIVNVGVLTGNTMLDFSPMITAPTFLRCYDQPTVLSCPRVNNYTDFGLGILQHRHDEMANDDMIFCKMPSENIFEVSGNVLWSDILHENCSVKGMVSFKGRGNVTL